LRTRKELLVAPSTTTLTAPPTHICLGSKNDTIELEGISWLIGHSVCSVVLDTSRPGLEYEVAKDLPQSREDGRIILL
jgi:hypothetical protein